MTDAMTAFWWGILSALSLPLGATLGLWLKPKLKVNSAFMAFGAGALLFALTIELFGHVPDEVERHGRGLLVTAVLAALAGGLLFALLNQALNNKGAFLRSFAVAQNYVARMTLKRRKKLVGELRRIKLFRDLSPKEMAQLIDKVVPLQLASQQMVFAQNEVADSMYFVVSGAVRIDVHTKSGGQKTLARLGPGDTFGELGVLSDYPRSADAITEVDSLLYRIDKNDVEPIIHSSPKLKKALAELAHERISEYELKSEVEHNEDWERQCVSHLTDLGSKVSVQDIRREGELATKGASSAAVAIWLGILIDGIPESLVIGMLAVSAKGMSIAFVTGVFLANLPEAMSSAVSMRSSGMGLKKIHLMWGSICIMTGIGAFIGAQIFGSASSHEMIYLVTAIEGVAAGAMLTMIAETMLPEAFEQGGSVVGLSTLGGFLAALVVKMM